MGSLRGVVRFGLSVCVAALAIGTPPASAQDPACGLLLEPTCVEAAPPGVTLQLTSLEENPQQLAPLPPVQQGQPLWAEVRNHLPYGYNAVETHLPNVMMSLTEEAEGHASVGSSMARVTAHWANIRQHPAEWRFNDLDAKYRAYIARGIRPVFDILSTPRRFTKYNIVFRGTPVTGCGSGLFCHNAPRAAVLSHLGLFARELAVRYPLAAGVEVWNEPNLSNPFWGGDQQNPAHYVEMLGAVYSWVKGHTNTMPVLGGAVATNGAADSTAAQSTRTFVRNIINAGASNVMDALSYHPYSSTMFSVHWNQDQIRLGYADAGVPAAYIPERLVATEIGVPRPTTAAPGSDPAGETAQANQLTDHFDVFDDADPAYPLSALVDGVFFHRQVTPPSGTPHDTQGGFLAPKQGGVFPTYEVWCDVRDEYGGFSPPCPATIDLTP